MSKRQRIANCRQVMRQLIVNLEEALGPKASTPYTMPLLEQLNALDRLDTELAADGKDGE